MVVFNLDIIYLSAVLAGGTDKDRSLLQNIISYFLV